MTPCRLVVVLLRVVEVDDDRKSPLQGVMSRSQAGAERERIRTRPGQRPVRGSAAAPPSAAGGQKLSGDGRTHTLTGLQPPQHPGAGLSLQSWHDFADGGRLRIPGTVPDLCLHFWVRDSVMRRATAPPAG